MTKKRIAAIGALTLIGLLYLATLILAFMDSPLARSCLMTALFCTIVLPAVLYGYLVFMERFRGKKDASSDSSEDAGSSLPPAHL